MCKAGSREHAGVYDLLYSRVKKVFERDHLGDASVTHHILQLNQINSVTGWYDKKFYKDEQDTEALVFTRSMSNNYRHLGVRAILDAMCFSFGYGVGDRITTNSGEVYEVKTNQPVRKGDGVAYWINDLKLLHYTKDVGESFTELLTDAKYRTKTWLTTYLAESANLPKYLICYGWPTYEVNRVFHEKLIDLVYSIGDPKSKPHYNADKSVDYYEEATPITVCCVDKTNIVGENLKWTGERELRVIFETYPFGAMRIMDDRRDTTEREGDDILYQSEVKLIYRREPV